MKSSCSGKTKYNFFENVKDGFVNVTSVNGSHVSNFLGTVSFFLNLLLKIEELDIDFIGLPLSPNLFFCRIGFIN
jgi:hypothetical protein